MDLELNDRIRAQNPRLIIHFVTNASMLSYINVIRIKTPSVRESIDNFAEESVAL